MPYAKDFCPYMGYPTLDTSAGYLIIQKIETHRLLIGLISCISFYFGVTYYRCELFLIFGLYKFNDMKKQFYSLLFGMFALVYTATANVGDTTWVQSFHGEFTQYGAFDTGVVFPPVSGTYRKIYMIITIGQYNCTAGSQYCHQWDYDVENYVMTPAGDTLELARFITPYATSGTPGFGSTWQQHYIYDVTDYYPILHDSATMQIFYSGYSWGFNGDVKFAFIEGTPERNVVGYSRLWNNTYTYGNPSSPIDSSLLPYTITPPAGTQSTELKFAITGHGYDNTSGCCEFDNTGVGHTYTVWANSNRVAQYNMNVNCGVSEIYPQGGTWLYQRAGNWCPGGSLILAQYKLSGITVGSPNTVDVSFDDSYNGGGNYGIYKIASAAFYYAGYNKTLDASLEDVIAPTNFEWYRRENPRASTPVVKVRNTGGTTITSLLFSYGVKDSAMTQYIWLGSIAPLHDTTLTLPALNALTNLSLNSSTGNYHFVAEIVQVNGQTDNDQSNDTITSTFSVAPTWPSTFIVKMLTSSIGANGNFGSNPADASWQITDQNNNVVVSRTNANVTTTYNDTVYLNTSSYYTLTVSTSQCYGLNWWALGGQSGYTPGSFSVLDYNNGNASLPLNGNNGNNSYYHDDFGCGFTQYFTTLGQCASSSTPTITRNGDTLIASAGVTFQWYNNGVLIPGATGSTYGMNHNDGNFTVQVTDGNGCIGTSSSYAVINLGLTNLYDVASLAIAPNPSSDAFTMTVNNALIGTTYTITDLTGRDVMSGIINATNTVIPVSGISSGAYLVTVSNGVTYITKHIAIAR
jgi:hypothetical protein